MEFLKRILGSKKKEKSPISSKEASFRKFGAEQFKTLAKKGLSVPVVLL